MPTAPPEPVNPTSSLGLQVRSPQSGTSSTGIGRGFGEGQARATTVNSAVSDTSGRHVVIALDSGSHIKSALGRRGFLGRDLCQPRALPMCSTKADDFVESATMNPAFEESAMFENMVDMMLKKAYDV